MTPDEALLSAIRAEPDDDGPRLVYADWLEEHGEQPRAEFIRVQCELARLPGKDPRSAALVAREQELRRAHEARWLLLPFVEPLRQPDEDAWRGVGDADILEDWQRRLLAELDIRRCLDGLPPSHPVYLELEARWQAWMRENYSPRAEPSLAEFVPFVFEEYHFHRGCVERVHMDENTFLIGAEGLFAATLPRHLKISYEDNSGESYTNGWGDATARLLGRWLHRTSLLTLDLCGIVFRKPGPIRALLTSPHLARLEVLNLECCNLDDDTVRALAASPHLTRLRALNLIDNPITDNAVDALLDAPVLEGLTTLELGSNGEHTISEDGYARWQERFEEAPAFESGFAD